MNIETVKQLVKQKPSIFLQLPIHLRENKEVILEAIYHYGYLYSYITDTNLKNDLDIVSLAVKSYPLTLTYTSEAFQKENIELLKDCIRINSLFYTYISPSMKNNIDIIITAIKSHSYIYKNIPESYRLDKKFSFLVLEINPYCYEYFSNIMKEDIDLARKILPKYPFFFPYIGFKLKSNINFIYEIIDYCPYIYRYLYETQKKDIFLIQKVIKTTPFLYIYIPKLIQNSLELNKIILFSNYKTIMFMDEKLQMNRNLIKTCYNYTLDTNILNVLHSSLKDEFSSYINFKKFQISYTYNRNVKIINYIFKDKDIVSILESFLF